MSYPAALTLILTLVAAILLISEKLRPDVIALLVMVTLGIARLVPTSELFTGFGGSAVITILAISIISEGLHQTGITQLIGRYMHRLCGNNEVRMLLVVMLLSAGISMFMNNIAAVGVLLPAVMSLSRQTQTAPSRLLMPLAFGTILGGMATLLTTSNIIVSGALRDAGHVPFGLLDFLPIGLPIVVVGVVYMLVVGRRLLPTRYPTGQVLRTQLLSAELTKLYKIDKNLYEIEVLPGSEMANLSIRQAQWRKRVGANIIGLARDGQFQIAPTSQSVILPGDIILAQGKPEKSALAKIGLRLLPDRKTTYDIANESVTLAEIVLSPHATLIGKTLSETKFRERYGLNVLAIWRGGNPVMYGIADIPLEFGDALLVQGSASRIRFLHAERDWIVLEEDPDVALKPRKGRLALIITVLTLGIAAVGVFPVAEVVMAGAVVMVLTDCLGMNDAYRTIEWKAIFLIAGMWPLSIAIRETGLASVSLGFLLDSLGSLTPLAMAGLLVIVALVLTQFMSGQVASLVLAPLAIAAAPLVQADPRSMGMAVALGCSLAFPTPFGHPVNVMVMATGGYEFRDFLRIGMPLTLLVIITLMAGLHFFWGL